MQCFQMQCFQMQCFQMPVSKRQCFQYMIPIYREPTLCFQSQKSVSNLPFMFPIYIFRFQSHNDVSNVFFGFQSTFHVSNLCLWFKCTYLRFWISKKSTWSFKSSKNSFGQSLIVQLIMMMNFRTWSKLLVTTCYSTTLQNLNRLGATKNRPKIKNKMNHVIQQKKIFILRQSTRKNIISRENC